jgi:glycosyltransferase involved in cell wall biosynthesis
MIRVCFIATGLDLGGAEVALLALLQHLDRTRFEPSVISLTTAGIIGPRIAALGVPVTAMGLRARPVALSSGLLRLVRQLRHERPDVVQTWMYHADLLGSLAARCAGIDNVVWCLHSSDPAPGVNKRGTVAVARLCARLSARVPRAVVSVSHAARDVHRRLGYRARHFPVIGNGVDVARFTPDPAAGAWLRDTLGLPPTAPLVLHVGRFHPQKNHVGLVRAAARVHHARPEVHFVLAGKDITLDNPALGPAIAAAGLAGVVHCLGPRDDAPRLMAGSDLLVLSSRSEASPLVLCEALASGIPCVTTDVGDARAMVADCGRTVAPADEEALAAALLEVLALSRAERAALGQRARQRAVAHFDIREMARAYENLYTELHARGAPPSLHKS